MLWPKVYLTSRALKHIYDKRPAEEYDALLNFIPQIITFPTRIYQNKNGKRGAYCFVKKIANEDYLVSLENSVDEPRGIYLVTAFRIRTDKYLEGYKLLWSWEDDVPPS